MRKREKVFRFKQFSIINATSGMKVGTDGVLIGAWARCGHGACSILDIGTGTGLIALMMAQRNAEATVTGIEIDDMAYAEARENMRLSPWSERINLISGDVIAIARAATIGEFDIIVSNPPYFANSLKSPDAKRSTARHTDTLPLLQFLTAAKSMLSDTGKLSFIYPYTYLDDIKRDCHNCGLHIGRICYVYSTPERVAERVMIECTITPTGTTAEETLTIEDATHTYTPEYIALTRDFYLKM